MTSARLLTQTCPDSKCVCVCVYVSKVWERWRERSGLQACVNWLVRLDETAAGVQHHSSLNKHCITTFQPQLWESAGIITSPSVRTLFVMKLCCECSRTSLFRNTRRVELFQTSGAFRLDAFPAWTTATFNFAIPHFLHCSAELYSWVSLIYWAVTGVWNQMHPAVTV